MSSLWLDSVVKCETRCDCTDDLICPDDRDDGKRLPTRFPSTQVRPAVLTVGKDYDS